MITNAIAKVAKDFEGKQFLPTMDICYKVSKVFDGTTHKEGDFYIHGKSSLTNTLECVPLCSKIKVVARNNDDEFIEAIEFTENEENWDTTEKYTDFMEKYCKEKIQAGVSVMYFLPKYNSYAEHFCKGKVLGRKAVDILLQRGSLLTLKTRKEPGNKVDPKKCKYPFIDIDIISINEFDNSTIDKQQFQLFNSESTTLLLEGKKER